MSDQRCAWITCERIVTPYVRGGVTPLYCSPLCRSHMEGYLRWLDGGGEDTTDIVMGNQVIPIDRKKAEQRAEHIKRMADARQEALW